MALRFAGFMILVLVVWCGHSASGDTSHSVHASDTSPLFKYGIPAGDDQVADLTLATTVSLPFNISFFGFQYNHVYISTDGTVGLEKAVDFNDQVKYSEGVKNSFTVVPFLAPLLYKAYRPFVQTGAPYQGKIFHRQLNYLDPKHAEDQNNKDLREYLTHYLSEAVINNTEPVAVKFAIVVTWSNVSEDGCVPSNTCNSTTFQLLLAGNDVNTFAIFNYEKYEISVGDNYEAGFNAGRNQGWFNVLPCHGGCVRYISNDSIRGLPNFQGSDLKGRYIFSVGQETVIRGGCLDKGLVAGILELYPRTVGMFGGEKLEVSGLCGTPNTKIYCRFGNAVNANMSIEGTMVNSMKGFCPVPPLTNTGLVDVYWSNDFKMWPADQTINVALPSRLGDPFVVDQVSKEAWNKRDSKEITVRWEPNTLSKNGTALVDIKLIGYRERKEGVEYRELKNFGNVRNSQGWYTIKDGLQSCTANCEEFEIGLLEVSLATEYRWLSSSRLAVRFGPIPLGWYVNQDMENRRGSDWSNQKCREWHQADSRNTEWIKNILPCPCTLDQAMADFGRWQADPGCNYFTGSQCHYHKGARHCVRSVVPTNDGSGNQCCYNQDGTLRHSQISYEGSTPDRSHAWGAYPYNTQDRVPELSHWKHDVISFYYCCLWNSYELCDLYMQQRPTADCRNYDVPGIGYVHGHTHVTTFDGLSYHFTGTGDFWLVQENVTSLQIQGKFQPREHSWDLGKLLKISSWKPKALIALAMSSGKNKIEVSLVPEAAHQKRGLDIRVNGQLKYFVDKASFWQDFQEFAVLNNAPTVSNNRHDNFTFLLNTFSVGVNVAVVNGLLHVVVAVPPRYKFLTDASQPKSGRQPRVLGLLGAYDGNANNDFETRQGQVIPPTTDKRTIYEKFMLSWKLQKSDYGIFTFDDTAKAEDTAFLYFEYNQIPSNFSSAPSHATVSQFCEGSQNCMYDYQITGEQSIAKATKESDVVLRNLKKSASNDRNCGLPEIGSNVIVSSENFSAGRVVEVSKCRNGDPLGKPVTFRCVENSQAGQNSNNVYWDPTPYTVCPVDTDDASSNLGLIIGVSVGAVVAIIVIIVIVVIVIKKRKSGKSSVKETRTPAERGKKVAHEDPAAAESMLTRVEHRSPVYKPSKEPVRMADLERGSNV